MLSGSQGVLEFGLDTGNHHSEFLEGNVVFY